MLKFQNNNTITIATFEDFILTAFVIIDELYFRYVPDAVSKRRNVLNAKLSDSEIITISICGELIGVDSENAWFSFVKKNYHHLFPEKMFSAFAMPYSRYLVIDSFPLAVCKFGRARYCQSFRSDGADYGKCPSKKETYFGFKVHAMITLEGFITSFEITPASTDDREGLRDLAANHSGVTILGDKGYIGEAAVNLPFTSPG